MTRAEFMRELERLLADIPESERTEALQYYNDYFDDAGVENELRVLVELGSPYEVAQSIKAGLNTEEKTEKPDVQFDKQNAYSNPTKKQMPIWAWPFVVIGFVIAAPLIFAVGITVISLLFAGFCVLFSLVLAFGGAALGLIMGGVVFLIAGLQSLLVPGVGVLLLGSGLVSLALGILMVMLAVLVIGVVIPGCVKLVDKCSKKIFRKKVAG